jgi:hypothetical protein
MIAKLAISCRDMNHRLGAWDGNRVCGLQSRCRSIVIDAASPNRSAVDTFGLGNVANGSDFHDVNVTVI